MPVKPVPSAIGGLVVGVDVAAAGSVVVKGEGDAVSAASPICSDFQTFCPDWLHFGHFLCFGGIAASQLSLRIFPIYF